VEVGPRDEELGSDYIAGLWLITVRGRPKVLISGFTLKKANKGRAGLKTDYVL
jgi:hypothetical protein